MEDVSLSDTTVEKDPGVLADNKFTFHEHVATAMKKSDIVYTIKRTYLHSNTGENVLI